MVLLLGSSGYVGKAVKQALANDGIDFICKSIRYPLDKQEFQRTLTKEQIYAVINCAGYTGVPNVDACELSDNKQKCIEANAFLPAQIMDVCNEMQVKMVHVSSGCIYNDYACENAYAPVVQFKEYDVPNFSFLSGNCSWYSGTKALGEMLCKQAYVCRLRIPFNGDINNRNYLCKMCNYDVLLNATNSFSQLDEFARGVVHVALYIDTVEYKRVFNMTQPGYLTTMQVIEMMRKHNIVNDKLYFKSIEEFNRTIKAPRSNCALNSSYIISKGIELTPIEDAMNIAIETLAYNVKHS